MTDNDHDITMPARLGSRHAKAVLGMVPDALDETSKNFRRLISRMGVSYFEEPRCGPKCRSLGQRNISLLRISAVSTCSSAVGCALVFLRSPVAHLPLASEYFHNAVSRFQDWSANVAEPKVKLRGRFCRISEVSEESN